MMGLQFLISCATVQIKDEQFCSPLPPYTDPSTGILTYIGATCDNFLTANQLILDETQWQALQATWISEKQAVECTNSGTLGDIKAELEKLCSVAKCSYQVKQKLKAILAGIEKIQKLGMMP